MLPFHIDFEERNRDNFYLSEWLMIKMLFCHMSHDLSLLDWKGQLQMLTLLVQWNIYNMEKKTKQTLKFSVDNFNIYPNTRLGKLVKAETLEVSCI